MCLWLPPVPHCPGPKKQGMKSHRHMASLSSQEPPKAQLPSSALSVAPGRDAMTSPPGSWEPGGPHTPRQTPWIHWPLSLQASRPQ